MAVELTVNGEEVRLEDVAGDGAPVTLLDALREQLGLTSAKDGCAPQGQCGCCTVLVDGAARVACVTPLRRMAGRSVETFEGLEPAVAELWTDAFLGTGGSQCGFCTPGIVMRLEERRRTAEGRDDTADGRDDAPGGREDAPGGADRAAVVAETHRALQAHLCRCTGWQGITEAAVAVRAATVDRAGRDLHAATARAAVESGGRQHVARDVVAGAAGFSADTAPPGCLVAVPLPGAGDPADPAAWVVADTVGEARRASGKVQGRRTTAEAVPPVEPPEGEWAATLATCWLEPAYLEVDASWCEPGGGPAGVLANGGAFGAKRDSPVPQVARHLADLHGRAVLALWSREDVVRHGPKRPPLAGGALPDGSGVLLVRRTPGIAEAVALAAPLLRVEEVDVPGPPTSAAIRGAGWVEAFCLLVAAGADSPLGGADGDDVVARDPHGGASARARVDGDGVHLVVDAGDPLDEVVLSSWATGAAHMAMGMVSSESLAVDADGVVHDLTIRSFGVLRAADLPRVHVRLERSGSGGDARPAGAAVVAAVAAATWRSQGFAPVWPTDLRLPSGP